MKKNKKSKKEVEIDSFIQLCKEVSEILKKIKQIIFLKVIRIIVYKAYRYYQGLSHYFGITLDA